jgi:hypothetical protein
MNDENQSKESAAWEKHRVEQTLQFRSLSHRQKMQAIEELGVIARRLQKIESSNDAQALSSSDIQTGA